MSKESLYTSEDHRILFRETFQDEFTVRRNGGTPTDMVFEKGIAALNGTSSKIQVNKAFKGIGSLRL